MKSARARFPAVQFLVSSAHDDQAMIDESLQSGATGYLIKDGASDALADAIRKVAGGERVVPGRLSEHSSRAFGAVQERARARWMSASR
jgi:two-component system response regulator DegU